jgi:hypothetical protein
MRVLFGHYVASERNTRVLFGRYVAWKRNMRVLFRRCVATHAALHEQTIAYGTLVVRT